MSNIPAMEKNFAELDSVNVPLSGIALIEAAAGTGKTYNIQNLAARLIVEKGFAIKSVVVVTFTELAARELAERLRQVLEDLHDVLHGKVLDKAENQERAKKLLERFDSCNIDETVQKQRVSEALRDFDEKCVSTIHGFCARVLSENAFESSVAFRVRLEQNIDQYIEKLLGDYCRIKRYGNSQLPGKDQLTVESLANPVKLLLKRKDMLPEYNFDHFDSEADLMAALESQKSLILNIQDAIECLQNFPGKLRKIGDLSGADHIKAYAGKIAELPEDPAAVEFQQLYEVLQGISRDFLQDYISTQGKGNYSLVSSYLDEHELFAAAERFCKLMEISVRLYFQQEAFEFVNEQLELWKQRDNFQGFDDLLLNLHSALQNGHLCNTLRSKYQAAIIDEFQDTDSVQYGIFRKIFVEDRTETVFFMVGDPRQAIYSFRGGDLATYMAARNECLEQSQGNIYQLSCNYRSSRAMIKAFNTVFEHVDLFAASGLTLPECRAPEKAKPGIFFNGKPLEDPLKVCHLPKLKVEDYCELWAGAVVSLLNDKRYALQEKDQLRNLLPGDIAVLAFDKSELEKMRQLLIAANVPVVCEHKNGIWGSAEAAGLLTFLTAVLEYGRDSVVREALLGDLAGFVCGDLDMTLPEAPENMQAWHQIFAGLNERWHQSGISAMLAEVFRMQWPGRTCSAGGSFKSRMGEKQNGDRVITNYVQLGDMLSGCEINEHLPPRGVLNCLADRIRRGEVDDESAEMLESDRTAVKLMTVHASKGLQFPVVFLPFMASRYPFKKKGMKLYHRNGRLCCNPDLTDPVAHELAGGEELQEIMRLVYVAITRACSACFIGWGKNQSKGTSPMDWLFGMRNCVCSDDKLRVRNFLQLADDLKVESIDIPADLRINELPGENALYYRPGVQAEVLTEPAAVRDVPDKWRLLSYSALLLEENHNRAADPDDEFLDYDQNSEKSDAFEHAAVPQELLSGGIWDIPGGAAIGNAWHKLLEVIDFTQEIKAADVRRILQLYNFDSPEYVDLTCRMLEKLFNYPLPCNMYSDELQFCVPQTVCLKDIPREKRICEFEFLLGSPEGINTAGLLHAMQDHLKSQFGNTYLPDDKHAVHGGFFTGFIDLIFEHDGRLYIADYKSNTLKYRAEAFYGEQLKSEMFQATYPVQYLCYTAAVVKYLEQRLQKSLTEELYSEYFGGVYYIFLRGLMLDEPGGVFAARPPLTVVKNMLKVMEGGAI